MMNHKRIWTDKRDILCNFASYSRVGIGLGRHVYGILGCVNMRKYQSHPSLVCMVENGALMQTKASPKAEHDPQTHQNDIQIAERIRVKIGLPPISHHAPDRASNSPEDK